VPSRRRAPPLWRWIVALLLLAVAAPALAQGQARAAEVEAAYLVNFLRYTQWPEQSFSSEQAPFVVTVIGSASVVEAVRAVASAAGMIDGRLVDVRALSAAQLSAPDPQALDLLRTSHLVFFHASEVDSIPRRLLDQLARQPVLTVSNIDDFITSGGMLELVNVDGHIVFEANPAAIHDAGLLVSAKVLKLARSVAAVTR
jgi:hypothetical protein